MCIDDLLDDCEAEPRVLAPPAASSHRLKSFEDPITILGCDPRSSIADDDLPAIQHRFDFDCDVALRFGVHVLNRVSDQVRKKLVEPGSVAENGGRIFGKSKLDVLFVESALQLGKDLLQDRPWVDVDTTMRGLFDSGKIEHVMQKSLHVSARLLDPIDEM